MSLRAKIEAVIYAAEEPVTLAQLSTLFAAEAREERAKRLVQEQGESAGTAAASGPELFPSVTARIQSAENAADEHAAMPPSDVAVEQAVEHPEQVSITQPDGFAPESEPVSDLLAPPGDDAARSDAGADAAGIEEARRLARQRDRDAREEIRCITEELIAAYDQGDRGMEIREIAGGYRVATKPEYHDAVRGFVKSLKAPMKLTLQALETLAVIAYKQPVTAPEVSEIRGVDSGGVLGSLITRKLVTTAGRKQVIGRPILYKTTKEFLLRFGLKDLAELPSMEEFEKMAGELVEPEAASQLDLATASARSQEGATSMPSIHPEERERSEEAFADQPSAAADVQASPEMAEAREEEKLAARARASVQVDEETASLGDLPGVTSDTAGRVNIDSHAHAPNNSDGGTH